MNMLWSWIDTNTLSLTFIEVFIKLTVILGLIAIASVAIKTTAATKRLWWSAGIVLALLLPIGTSLLPSIEIAWQQQSENTVSRETITPTPDFNAPIPSINRTVQNPSVQPTTRSETNLQQSKPWFTGLNIGIIATVLWIVGLILIALKLWRQNQCSQTIWRNAEQFQTWEWNKHSNGNGNIPIYISDDIATPIALGIFNPRIVLPVAAKQWSAEKLAAAIQHELAHVRGRDNLVRCCASLLCALYWFHPLVWYSARKLHEEQEKAADNAVINQGISASSYAQSLLDIVKSLQGNTNDTLIHATMASYSFFPQRMRSILSDSQNRQSLSLSKTVATIAMVVTFAIPITMLTTQTSNAQDDDADEPVRYIDFAQNTISDAKPQLQSDPSTTPNPRPNPSQNSSPDLKLFQDLDTSMTEAINRGDLNALVNFYTDDAVLVTENGNRNERYRGKNRIKNYWDDLLDTDMKLRSQVTSVDRSGDNATVDVRYWASFDTDIGSLTDFIGGTTTTNWQLIDGQWRIINDLVREPDYVNNESIDLIVDTALTSATTAINNIDWSEISRGINEAMQSIGRDIDFDFSWDDNWNISSGQGRKSNPLLNAIESGNSKSVKLLLENGADANSTERSGRSALYLASEAGNDDMVELLLKHKADVNATSRYGKSSLYVAAENGHLNIVKLLIKHDAEVNTTSRYGRTPLSVAAAEGNDKIVEYLLEHGAKANL